ncbi:MAG TPA: MgtC/SapB family protein [Oscillospiraceae bacterium]|nr:MgtC/SapB family protein [Oscillospiraceae bacterium]HPF55880.1 MgtC/SapB family protein [Clostridiales bacterium]HPK35177.1 MgtC/SapB family protein [Oscillospiraceae bacterium]HPR74980.1 MgtC/SapB family protein [Oscillospiraceae bacterium]
MNDIIDFLRDFNIWTVLIRLVLAFVCGGIIGTERELKGRSAGIRTHILVALGSVMATMTGFFAMDTFALSSDPLRVAAQVISGIGFLGVGTILVTGHSHIRGLTTAAGIWTTAAIGVALGAGFYEGALICTVLAFISIGFLQRLERRVKNKKGALTVYVEIKDADRLNEILEQAAAKSYQILSTQIVPAKSGMPNYLGIEMKLIAGCDINKQQCLHVLSKIEGVSFAVETY